MDIGFIGAGYMGQLAHLWNYYNIEDCNIVGLAEPREELATKVAQRYEIKETYHTHTELLRETTPDAIVAIVDYTHHHTVLSDVLKEGIPTFSEKPLALSVESAMNLAELGRSNGTLHMIGYNKRSDPAMEYAKKKINQWKETGKYGQMNHVRITIPPGNGAGGVPDPIMTDETPPDQESDTSPAELDGEAGQRFDNFLPFYVHQINLLRCVFGCPYEVTFADPTGTVMVAESQDGVSGVIEMTPYSSADDWQESVFVGFDDAYIELEFAPPLARQQAGDVKIWTENDAGESAIEHPTMPAKSSMRNQAENFLSAVRGERSPPCTADEAISDIKIARDYIERLQSHEEFSWGAIDRFLDFVQE